VPGAPQQADGSVTAPELERLGLLVRLVVLRRRHLQHGITAGRRHERIPRECKRLAELNAPLGGDLPRDPLEQRDVGTVVAQLSRSTTMAMP
jgi:hypothetical protein